jgi:hypothetical protein
MGVCVISWHAWIMLGISMCWRQMECKYYFFPFTFAIIIMPIGYYVARKRETLVLSSSCLLAGTNLSWLGLRWAKVVMLG